MTFRHRNSLEGLLEQAGYPAEHAVIWADILLRQVETTTADTALVGFWFRTAPIASIRDALRQMPPHILALCLARMVAFGMPDTEIKSLMPEVNYVQQ